MIAWVAQADRTRVVEREEVLPGNYSVEHADEQILRMLLSKHSGSTRRTDLTISLKIEYRLARLNSVKPVDRERFLSQALDTAVKLEPLVQKQREEIRTKFFPWEKAARTHAEHQNFDLDQTDILINELRANSSALKKQIIQANLDEIELVRKRQIEEERIEKERIAREERIEKERLAREERERIAEKKRALQELERVTDFIDKNLHPSIDKFKEGNFDGLIEAFDAIIKLPKNHEIDKMEELNRNFAALYRVRTAAITLPEKGAESYCRELDDLQFSVAKDVIPLLYVARAECGIVRDNLEPAKAIYESLLLSHPEQSISLGVKESLSLVNKKIEQKETERVRREEEKRIAQEKKLEEERRRAEVERKLAEERRERQKTEAAERKRKQALSKVAEEIKICEELGFVKGSERFGDCVVTLVAKKKVRKQASVNQKPQERTEVKTVRPAPKPKPRGDGTRDDRTCQSYGFSYGTAGYSDCRMKLDAGRRQAAAAQARYEQEKRLYDEQIAAIERQKRKDRGMRQLEFGLCMLAGGCGSSSSSSTYQYTPPPPPRPSNFNLFLSNGRSVTCMHNHNVIDCR